MPLHFDTPLIESLPLSQASGRRIWLKLDALQQAIGHRFARLELLQQAEKSQSDLACPHGVRFYDVAKEASRSERAAWSYEAPRASMQKVDHYIGFWGDVEVR
mgnify:CR=1 FL=1